MITSEKYGEILELWTKGDGALRTAIQDTAQVRELSAGETLLLEGDHSNDVFLLLEGTIAIILYSLNGHEVRLNTLDSGNWLGEMAALNTSERTAFAVVSENGCAAVLPARSFLGLMESNGKFATRVAQQLSKRLAYTSKRMFEFAAFSSPGRIYSEIIRLSVPGDDSEERHIIPAPSVTELAARLSVARETASRAINRLEKMRLLVRYQQSWKVLAPERLSDMIQ